VNHLSLRRSTNYINYGRLIRAPLLRNACLGRSEQEKPSREGENISQVFTGRSEKISAQKVPAEKGISWVPRRVVSVERKKDQKTNG